MTTLQNIKKNTPQICLNDNKQQQLKGGGRGHANQSMGGCPPPEED